jgi:hypothetical protein
VLASDVMMNRPTTVLFITALLSVGALARADQPATQPEETLAGAKAKMSLETAAESVGMPVINAKTVADVMTVSIRDQDLQVSTPLKQTEQSIVSVPGLVGLTKVTVDAIGDNRDVPLRRFQLENIDFTSPDTISVHTSVSSMPGDVRINQDLNRLDDQVHSVQLIQNTRELNEGETRIALYVQITGTPAVELRLTGDNIVDLRQKYPAEVAKYVDPIFRTLRQEGLLAKVDPKLAWQVFADAYQPPADVVSKVQQLVVQLDADSFPARESATQALEQLGQPAALALLHMDRKTLSDEQRGRVDAFLAKFKTTGDDRAKQLRRDRDFLLDCLYSDEEPIRRRALEELRKVVGEPIEFDITAPSEQRLAAIERLRRSIGAAPTTQRKD